MELRKTGFNQFDGIRRGQGVQALPCRESTSNPSQGSLSFLWVPRLQT